MRPSRIQVLMATAHIWAERSTCERMHVGCVLELEGRILTTGYNGAPAGMEHCFHSCNCELHDVTAPPEKHHVQCHALINIPCRIAVHAEANAIAFAARHGIALVGARLFTTMAPCYACSQLIINAGVSTVIYDDPYRDMTGIELLVAAGVTVETIV